jgi:xylan 1,4-beta-xylosidase
MSTAIRNPILPGFNPDPSIVRVGDDYYIATSTFEWYPGVQIYHSRDLVHWRLLTRPLTRASQLNMEGDPDSTGIWAPCLSYADGLFHLIYTDVKRYGRMAPPGLSVSLRDFQNYLVTSPTIDGEWSEPIFMNSSGFDPSLFHDDDGRKWFVNMLWDHRPSQNRFAGIVLQEYSTTERKLIGERVNIFKGTSIGFTEAPHLYKRNGWYYLITAEGGTMWGHAVTLARSRSITGPYELHPDTYILTARDKPHAALQRAGHADLVDTKDGRTYMVYLCGRPIPNRGRCVLGRETAIQEMRWGSDDWLYTLDKDATPTVETPAPDLPAHPFPSLPVREDFNGPELPIDFQWLRTPHADQLFSLTARPGHLRLYGRESIVDFEPKHFQQAAGLVCYYNLSKYHYFYISHDDTVGRHLRVLTSLPDQVALDVSTAMIPIPAGPVKMRVEVDFERLYFGYRIGGGEWQWLPQMFDASILSDEATAPGAPNFTGAFVGVACQDASGTGHHADVDFFEYREREYLKNPKTDAI